MDEVVDEEVADVEMVESDVVILEVDEEVADVEVVESDVVVLEVDCPLLVEELILVDVVSDVVEDVGVEELEVALLDVELVMDEDWELLDVLDWEVVELEETGEENEYMVNLLLPPQYSVLFPLHAIEHPEVAGVPPFMMELPHPEMYEPKKDRVE
ncbi:MAG: hypothetical protein Q9181_002360 [Wetmoreana brouardii]